MVRRMGIDKTAIKIGKNKAYVTEKIIESRKQFIAKLKDSFGFGDGDEDEDEDAIEDRFARLKRKDTQLSADKGRLLLLSNSKKS